MADRRSYRGGRGRMASGTGRPGLHIEDAAALVVGYGLASLLVRAYWPAGEAPGPGELILMAGVFVWLGLAMSGPVVLLIRRPGPVDPSGDGPPGSRTWAEMAWMIIGVYWIFMAVLVVPARLRGALLMDSAILGLFPVLAALALRFFGPAPTPARPADAPSLWTHRVGVGLLLTWPFAWVGLILLGKSLI